MGISLAAATLGGAALGGASSLFGGAAQRKHASGASRKAYLRQRQMMQDAPSLHAKGLEKAGLNRILAAGGQPTGANVQQDAPTSNVESEAIGKSIEAAATALQMKKIKSEITLNEKLGNKAQNEADVTGAKVPLMQTIGNISKQALDAVVTPAKSSAKKFQKQFKDVKKSVKPEHKNYFQSPQYFKFGR